MEARVQSGNLTITKTAEPTNPSDVFTQFPQADMLKRHIQRIGMVASVFNHIFKHQVKRTSCFNSTAQRPTSVVLFTYGNPSTRLATVLQRTI